MRVFRFLVRISALCALTFSMPSSSTAESFQCGCFQQSQSCGPVCIGSDAGECEDYCYTHYDGPDSWDGSMCYCHPIENSLSR